jgi:hypothetical protein
MAIWSFSEHGEEDTVAPIFRLGLPPQLNAFSPEIVSF